MPAATELGRAIDRLDLNNFLGEEDAHILTLQDAIDALRAADPIVTVHLSAACAWQGCASEAASARRFF